MTEPISTISERLPYVIPKLTDWPIYRLSEGKENFLKQVISETEENILESIKEKKDLHNLLKNVLYQEKNRLTKEPWKADKPEERIFWSEIKRKILLSAQEEDENLKFNKDKKILKTILKHYAQEIVASFNPRPYKFARALLPWLFGRLMNASPDKKWKFLSASGKTVFDKLKITGPLSHLRSLAKKGTVVVVPTHFSNLDSPLIGFVIDAIGLPAMTYGAGLNLFTVDAISNFMDNVGAYKVDRRKKNKPYLELLKNYSNVAIQRGAHSLFFPGGTRSRSGKLESKLKLGLLSTAVEAQRRNLLSFPEETAQKIFIVPVVINYHFVMEAASLINQHLKYEGKEQYISDREELSTSYTVLKLIYKFLTATAGMTVSFGKPMDVFGNKVDDNGNSINSIGQKVSIKDYFLLNGDLTEDRQRDGVYTSILSEKIVEQFFKANTVLSSHLVAFVAFQMLVAEYKHFDLYQILRIPADEIEIEYDLFVIQVEKLKNRLIEMEAEKKLQLSDEIKGSTDNLIKDGLRNLGVYHSQLPLIKSQNGNLTTEDIKLLYYYHNRLTGYGLSKFT